MGFFGVALIWYLSTQALAETDIYATYGIDVNAWWGDDDTRCEIDKSKRPFEVTFDDEMIEDLKYRLTHHRHPVPPLNEANFTYGFNSNILDSWLQYWAHNFSFTESAKRLNSFPQYLVNIQGVDIHFIEYNQEATEGQEILPLLLLHGWPGSTVEFLDAIPYLTAISEERNFAVKVIAPNMPGFAYSGFTSKQGLGANEMAVLYKILMEYLGYDKFFIQGGDWGNVIGSAMATLFPDIVIGFHSNFPLALNQEAIALTLFGSQYPSYVVDSSVEHRMYPLKDKLLYLNSELGYFHLIATKPDTIGVAMSDSPGGLMAFLLQSFSSGTRKYFVNLEDGGLEKFFTKDQLLDSIMMYWAPNSITTSFRIYAESVNRKELAKGIEKATTSVPTCSIHAIAEILYQSPTILKTRYKNLLNSTIIETGGHFLAFELPELFAENVLNCITLVRKWRAENANESEDSS